VLVRSIRPAGIATGYSVQPSETKSSEARPVHRRQRSFRKPALSTTLGSHRSGPLTVLGCKGASNTSPDFSHAATSDISPRPSTASAQRRAAMQCPATGRPVLHHMQASLRFWIVSSPPSARGRTWSTVASSQSCRMVRPNVTLVLTPQYEQFRCLRADVRIDSRRTRWH
jgi:hypothetical protein